MDKKELIQALNQPHDVTVVSVSHLTYSIDKSEKLFEGDTVTITVTPETHYQLLASGIAIVTSAGTNITFNYSGNRITFTMPNDDVQVTLTATALPTYSVTLRFTGSAGSSSIWASKTTGIYEGETITVNVSPASHFNISGWSSSPSVSFSGSGNSRSFVMPASNVTVSVAMVEDPKYNITTSASGGSVSVSKTSAYAGETITVRMSPNAYYKYQSLSVKTSSGSNVTLNSNNGSTATFTMPASNVSVQATFVANATHYITPGSFYQNVGFTGEILLYGSIEPDILSNSKIISLTCDGSITYFRVSLNSGDTIVNRTVQIIRLDTMAKIQGVMAYVSNNTWYGFTESIQLFTSSDVGKRISLVISVG